MADLSLTPIIEELSNIRLTSTVKRVKDDSDLHLPAAQLLADEIEPFNLPGDVPSQGSARLPSGVATARAPTIDRIKNTVREDIGDLGMRAWEISKRKTGVKLENYSVSLISAISQERVIANQLVQGGVDSTVFENFIFELLTHIRSDTAHRGKRVVLLMDNARIHCHKSVVDIAMDMKAILLYSAQYSPWLNPVEHLFALIKRRIRQESVHTR